MFTGDRRITTFHLRIRVPNEKPLPPIQKPACRSGSDRFIST